MKFSFRVAKSSRLCRNVFRKADEGNYYTFMLKKDLCEILAQKMLMILVEDKKNLAAVRQAVAAIGKAQRALEAGDTPVAPAKPLSDSHYVNN